MSRREMTLKIYPDRSVEVDPPGAWPVDSTPPNAPWLYLRDAARALRDCGSAPALYAGWRGENGRGSNAGFAYLNAPTRRTEFARTSVLFSSFAAEAYVNAFLAESMGDGFAQIERAPTIEKYVTHVKSTRATVEFTKGRQPGQGLVLLFKARNMLVHPKKNVPLKPEITPKLAADSIVAVARAAWTLTAAVGNTDMHALAVAKQASLFRRWADVCSTGVPDIDDAPAEDLFVLALNAEMGPALNREAARAGLRSKPSP
jgi:hypothetical protein